MLVICSHSYGSASLPDFLGQGELFIRNQLKAESVESVRVALQPAVKEGTQFAGYQIKEADLGKDCRVARKTCLWFTLAKDGELQRVKRWFDVSAMVHVARASSHIIKGRKLVKDSCIRSTARFGSLGNLAVSRCEEVVGRVSARAIRKGQQFSQLNIRDKPVVLNGDLVELIIRSGGIDLVSNVRAVSSANVGEQILVKVPNGNKPVRAIVANSKRVYRYVE